MNNIEILEFSASWCGPCKALANELKEFPYKIKQIDVDKNKKLTKCYAVLSVPTIIILKNGEELLKIRGFISKSELLDNEKNKEILVGKVWALMSHNSDYLYEDTTKTIIKYPN